MSMDLVTGKDPLAPTQSSGAKKAGVPAVFASALSSGWSSSDSWETPKSEILTTPSLESKRFSGLMSR